VVTGGEKASTTLQYLGNGQWLTPGSLGDSFTYMERHSLSRIEVLVVIGVVSVAGVLLVSAFGRTTQGPREVACLSNTRRLVDAWQMYARDNHEVLLWAYGSHSNMAPYVWSGPAGYPWDIAPEKSPLVLLRQVGRAVALPGGQFHWPHAQWRTCAPTEELFHE